MIHDIVALKRNDSLEKINDININDKMIRSLSDDSVQNSILSEELFLLDDVWEDIKTVIKDFFSVVCIIIETGFNFKVRVFIDN